MLKLNKKTEYGLLALQYMLARENSDVATVKEIAEHHKISQSLLAKILQSLARQKIIKSVQGARGGYSVVSSFDLLRSAILKNRGWDYTIPFDRFFRLY